MDQYEKDQIKALELYKHIAENGATVRQVNMLMKLLKDHLDAQYEEWMSCDE